MTPADVQHFDDIRTYRQTFVSSADAEFIETLREAGVMQEPHLAALLFEAAARLKDRCGSN